MAKDSGIYYKLYDNRNRLMFVSPVRANILEMVSEILEREVKYISYDCIIGGRCKVVVCKDNSK